MRPSGFQVTEECRTYYSVHVSSSSVLARLPSYLALSTFTRISFLPFRSSLRIFPHFLSVSSSSSLSLLPPLLSPFPIIYCIFYRFTLFYYPHSSHSCQSLPILTHLLVSSCSLTSLSAFTYSLPAPSSLLLLTQLISSSSSFIHILSPSSFLQTYPKHNVSQHGASIITSKHYTPSTYTSKLPLSSPLAPSTPSLPSPISYQPLPSSLSSLPRILLVLILSFPCVPSYLLLTSLSILQHNTIPTSSPASIIRHQTIRASCHNHLV